MKTSTQLLCAIRVYKLLAILLFFLTSGAQAQDVAPTTSAGLSVNYYSGYFDNNRDFFTRTSPGIVDRVVPSLNFPQAQTDNFNVGSVATYYSPDRPDEFSALFQGRIYVTNAGTYTFYLGSDDAASLWFDDEAQATASNVDDMKDYQRTQAKKVLTEGFHDVRVYYGEHGGSQGLVLEYEGPNMPRQLVPNGVLYPEYGGTPSRPVLTQFDAVRQGQEVHLVWTTQNEQNCRYFVVERSADGVTFEDVARLAGAEQSAQPRGYAFVDQQPLIGVNYYRLRQELLEGTVYSPIKSATIEAIPTTISVYPNPNAGYFTIYIKQSISQAATLELTDMNGHSQFVKQLPANGFEASYAIQPELATGVYILRLQTASGTSNQKLMINR